MKIKSVPKRIKDREEILFLRVSSEDKKRWEKTVKIALSRTFTNVSKETGGNIENRRSLSEEG